MRNSLCWMPLMLSEHTSTTLWSAHPRIPRLCRSTVPHLPLHPKAILPQPGAPTAIWRGGHVLCFFLFSVLSLHVLLRLMLLSINSERRRKYKRVLGKHSRLPSKNSFLHHYGRIIRYYQGSIFCFEWINNKLSHWAVFFVVCCQRHFNLYFSTVLYTVYCV